MYMKTQWFRHHIRLVLVIGVLILAGAILWFTYGNQIGKLSLNYNKSSASSCESIYRMASCQATPGCTYDYGAKKCRTGNQCTGLLQWKSPKCSNTPGCQWDSGSAQCVPSFNEEDDKKQLNITLTGECVQSSGGTERYFKETVTWNTSAMTVKVSQNGNFNGRLGVDYWQTVRKPAIIPAHMNAGMTPNHILRLVSNTTYTVRVEGGYPFQSSDKTFVALPCP